MASACRSGEHIVPQVPAGSGTTGSCLPAGSGALGTSAEQRGQSRPRARPRFSAGVAYLSGGGPNGRTLRPKVDSMMSPAA
jgi:hypothetical protein